MDKSRLLVSLWQKVNTHRAGLAPAQPPLLVGPTDVTSFQSLLGHHAHILQNVATKKSVLKSKKNQLRATGASHFLAGLCKLGP